MKTIIGVISDREHAELAIEDLKTRGYKPDELSIIMRDQSQAQEMSADTGVDVVSGTATGATTGAVLGGLAGLLASYMIPGLGAFFIGGPIASALGLTGAAATTASGAATGALAGGFLGALTGLGLSEDDARLYEESVNAGKILIAVPVLNESEKEVEGLLRAHYADQIKSINASTGTDRFEDKKTLNKSVDSKDFREEISDYSPKYHTVSTKGGKSKRTSESG